MLGFKRYPITNRTVFDVTTFEVKLGGNWDITAILRRPRIVGAHTTPTPCSTMLNALAPNDEIIDRCKREAQRLGVGIYTTDSPETFDTWDPRVDSVRQAPDPSLVEDFVRVQVSPEGRETVKKWWQKGAHGSDLLRVIADLHLSAPPGRAPSHGCGRWLCLQDRRVVPEDRR